MLLGLGISVVENLIAGLAIGLGLDIGMGVGMDADSIVNIFSSCCYTHFHSHLHF